MGKDVKVKITVSQGCFLLKNSPQSKLPEKLGETKYNLAERSYAWDHARGIYRLMASYSPIHQASINKLPCFGPEECYREYAQESGDPAYRLIEPQREVEVRLTEDDIDGIMWIMILATHPQSEISENLGYADNVIWPLAARLQKVGALRKAVGLTDDSKAKPSRWADDEVPEVPDGNKEEKPEEKKVVS